MRTSVSLEEVLKENSYRKDVDEFRKVVIATFMVMFPDYTDEELGHRPTEALRFCNEIRKKAKLPDLPEHVIMRTLQNCRKRGHGAKHVREKITA